MSYWARTVDPSFSAPEASFEPIRAELVAGPPPDSPTRGRCTSVAVRACRLVGVVLLVIIVWLLGAHFWSVRSRSTADQTEVASVQEVAALEVAVYYEAFCPDSRSFIVDQLWPTYQRMPDTMRVDLVPYGKAKTAPPAAASDGAPPTFSCHHGAEECRANLVHACGLRLAERPRQALRFVVCLLRQMRPELFQQQAVKCAGAHNISWPELDACAGGANISHVMQRYGERTEALRPRLSFVPTVTINGSQDRQEEMRTNFLDFVCKSYQGRGGQKLTGCP